MGASERQAGETKFRFQGDFPHDNACRKKRVHGAPISVPLL
jgi:hypothetical protein